MTTCTPARKVSKPISIPRALEQILVHLTDPGSETRPETAEPEFSSDLDEPFVHRSFRTSSLVDGREHRVGRLYSAVETIKRGKVFSTVQTVDQTRDKSRSSD
jgi:hypothetical protein